MPGEHEGRRLRLREREEEEAEPGGRWVKRGERRARKEDGEAR